MKKIAAAVFLLIAFFGLKDNLFCAWLEEVDVQSQIIKGKVVDIDWLKSEITIEFKQKNNNDDKIILAIVEATKIKKDDVEISANEIFKGDLVIVEYYINPKSVGPPIAREINVASSP